MRRYLDLEKREKALACLEQRNIHSGQYVVVDKDFRAGEYGSHCFIPIVERKQLHDADQVHNWWPMLKEKMEGQIRHLVFTSSVSGRDFKLVALIKFDDIPELVCVVSDDFPKLTKLECQH